MTEEKSVGKFETYVLRIIGGIAILYVSSAQTFVALQIPAGVAIIFTVSTIGYFVNRFVLKWEQWIDHKILISNLEATKKVAGEPESRDTSERPV